MVRLTDYPQLRCIAWSRRPDGEMTGEGAFLHEKHWDMGDQAALNDSEKALTDRSAREVGHGYLDT